MEAFLEATMSYPPPHHQVAVGETTDIRIFEYKYEVIPIPLKEMRLRFMYILGMLSVTIL